MSITMTSSWLLAHSSWFDCSAGSPPVFMGGLLPHEVSPSVKLIMVTLPTFCSSHLFIYLNKLYANLNLTSCTKHSLKKFRLGPGLKWQPCAHVMEDYSTRKGPPWKRSLNGHRLLLPAYEGQSTSSDRKSSVATHLPLSSFKYAGTKPRMVSKAPW